MAAANWFRYSYRAYLSTPKSFRQVYRLVKCHSAARIVEIGISDLSRTVSLIEVAQRFAENNKVHHTGVDGFDLRPEQAVPLTLKEAYRTLRATGANVRLVPGPANSLSTVANSLQNTDLILISSAVSDDELRSAWFYVPRMLHQRSVILRERVDTAEPVFEWLTHSQIAEWAGRFGSRRAA